VLCGVQREEAPRSGPLKLMLGTDPKAARREAGYRARLRVLGCSFSHFGEQEKSGSRAESRKRGAAVEGDFWAGLGHSVEAIYRRYGAAETAHTQGHI
jgi:hypothetical protein